MVNARTIQLIELIQTLLDVCYLTYLFTGVILVLPKLFRWARTGDPKSLKKNAGGRWINRIWYWTKWPALAYVILNPFFYWATGQKMGWVFWLFEAFAVFNWWSYRDAGDDDDEFKKQFKKAAKKIIVSGSKLIVVPETA